MWSRSLALALLLLPAPALAGVKENVAALAPQGLVLVMDAKGNESVAQNTDEPFVPASVTKIVTAWLAMEVLGGDYRFKTRFRTSIASQADRKSTRLNSSHLGISYAVFCLEKKHPKLGNGGVGARGRALQLLAYRANDNRVGMVLFRDCGPPSARRKGRED